MGEVGDALWYTACSLRFATASLAVVCVYRCCDRVTLHNTARLLWHCLCDLSKL